MLKLGEFIFEDDWSNRRSSLMYFERDEDEEPSWSVDIGFSSGEYNGEEVSPALFINPIETDKESVAELVGESFSIKTIEESEYREDLFYIYEHEPFVEYELEILAIESDKAHVKCSGTIIADGYTVPSIREKFEIDSWVPVIESVEDWEKFGL